MSIGMPLIYQAQNKDMAPQALDAAVDNGGRHDSSAASRA
jgi:hypothetical protein